MIISHDIHTELNSLFNLKTFLTNKDYRNNNWFVDENWNTIVIDYFSLNEDDLKTNLLFSLFGDTLYLTSMPFDGNEIEGKQFNSGLDFIEEMSMDDTFPELDFYSWTVFSEKLDMILIYESEDEAFYLGYHKKHEIQVQKKLVKTNLILPFVEYIEHSNNLDKLFKKD